MKINILNTKHRNVFIVFLNLSLVPTRYLVPCDRKVLAAKKEEGAKLEVHISPSVSVAHLPFAAQVHR